MSANILLALPVDGRPVVREQVQWLVESAGWDLQVPEVSELGHLRQPADRDALAQWLRARHAQAAALVVSIDMLVYGGLVPSRFVDDGVDALLARLDLLRELKAQQPTRPLYAFAATMRISNNNVNEEEKLYWSEYGSLIWQWSYYSDRYTLHGAPADQARSQDAASRIPLAVQQDYMATRARNFAINQTLLDFVAQGVIDRLILPQDDTAEFGFNIAERRQLQQQVLARGLTEQVLIYPGADEVLHTLCAHAVSRLRNDPPLKLWMSCSDPAHVGQLRALYEDRPVLDSVASQVHAVGAMLVDDPAQADVVLAVHTQGREQGDWAMRKALPQPQPLDNLQAWFSNLRSGPHAALPLAMVDLAYANGSDPALVALVAQSHGIQRLAAYSGWNTASNSLGSLLAQLVLARGRYSDASNQRNVVLRIAEDWGYQSWLRQVLRDALAAAGGESTLDPAALAAQAHATVVPALNAWCAQQNLPWRIAQSYLPWDRTFEIGLRLEAA
ncbi:MAG: DUF4127 family protein [Rhodoferax sp.]|nr:DUF4127 family protein [Rhodoferax sp.]